MTLRKLFTALGLAPSRKKKPKLSPKKFSYTNRFEEEAPFFRAILHLGDGAAGSQHIYRQWRDVFQASRIKYLPLFRNRNVYVAACAEWPEDTFALAVGNDVLPSILGRCLGIRAVYYSGNSGNIVNMLIHDSYRHVFIGHGDSDKHTSATRVFKVYDEVWVAGNAHKERLEKIPHSWNFRVVGRPQGKRLALSGASAVPMTACYLPTWEGPNEGSNYSSIAICPEMVEVARELGISLAAKLHPSTGFRDKRYANLETELSTLGVSVAPRSRNAIDLMETAAFCITDISSIVSDWMISRRPVFVYVSPLVDRRTVPIHKYAYVFSDAGEFLQLLQRVVIDGDDFLKDSRITASEYLVSNSATITDEFHRAMQELDGVCRID